nr:MAG TPA: hypothetical protein [Bacteriophage sp.]
MCFCFICIYSIIFSTCLNIVFTFNIWIYKLISATS